MSMYTALSGISAAQHDITTTSHNIANVSTTGFKSSRAEFADLFSTSPLTVSRTATGSGVQVSGTSQSFSQGNVTSTGNGLDLAIEGAGFFAIQTEVGQSVETQYTRAGAFHRDVDGRIINAGGSALLGWPVAQDGSPLSNNPADGFEIIVPALKGSPTATTEVGVGANFPSDSAMIGQQSAVPPTSEFSVTDPTSYAFTSPVTVMSEDGTPLNVQVYFMKTKNADFEDPSTAWEARLVMDGNVLASDQPSAISFNMAGEPEDVQVGVFEIHGNPVRLNLGRSVVEDQPFRVLTATNDGVSPSSLYALDIDATGTVYGTYSDGESVAIAKIFLADFPNPNGLRQMGGTALALTPQSGKPILGMPSQTGFGLLRSGALERSNVELTAELVNLITAQRNYQASAKAMETASSLSQTILNMRS